MAKSRRKEKIGKTRQEKIDAMREIMAMHGIDIEAEIAAILSQEVIREIKENEKQKKRR